MPAAISPYSIAVAPDSSATNSFNSFLIITTFYSSCKNARCRFANSVPNGRRATSWS
jgi:hypothetical protein